MAETSLLWSYVYARGTKVPEELAKLPVDRLRYFADSGAHSARTLGIHLALDDYATWLEHYQHHMTIYANLDVIWGPKATWENQRRLEDRGLDPMPVFHTGEPWSWLEKYLEEGYTYIALGKLLGNPWSKLRPWLQQAFRMVEGTAVLHGFGLTAWPAMREFPFYSVDSSSWTSPYRWGTLTLFDNGRWANVHVRNLAHVKQHRRLLEDYGVDLRILTKGGWDRRRVGMLSAESYMRAVEWAAERHGPIPLPDGKGYPKGPRAGNTIAAGETDRFHLYFAETNRHHDYHCEQATLRSQRARGVAS